MRHSTVACTSPISTSFPLIIGCHLNIHEDDEIIILNNLFPRWQNGITACFNSLETATGRDAILGLNVGIVCSVGNVPNQRLPPVACIHYLHQ